MTNFTETDHPRVADGTFTEKAQTKPETSLSGGTPAEEVFAAVESSSTRGQYTLESVQTHPPIDFGKPILISIGGDAHVNTRVGAAARLFSSEESGAAREEYEALITAGKNSMQKLTVMSVSDRGIPYIHEGTGAELADGRRRLLCKGSRTKAYDFTERKLLGVVKNYGGQDALAARFQEAVEQVPVTEPVTFDGIPEYDGSGEQNSVAAVYLMDGPDFGNGSEPGCMFFATDIQTSDNIVNGYFWAPSDAGLLTSESGSFYLHDFKRKAGRIRDYEPGSMSFTDAAKLDSDRATGYKAVVGK